MKIRKCGLLAVAFVALLLGSAKFWETKKYTEWDEEECKQLLTKSPWAFTNSFGRLSEIGFRVGGEPPGIDGPWPNKRGERESYIIFECRLLSAKPIRMALARLQMFENPQAPAAMESVQQYVNSNPGKEILVQVSFRTKPANASTMQSLLSMFRRASLASFRETTLLISDKRKSV